MFQIVLWDITNNKIWIGMCAFHVLGVPISHRLVKLSAPNVQWEQPPWRQELMYVVSYQTILIQNSNYLQ